jgi:hypothetical protein
MNGAGPSLRSSGKEKCRGACLNRRGSIEETVRGVNKRPVLNFPFTVQLFIEQGMQSNRPSAALTIFVAMVISPQRAQGSDRASSA